MYLNLWCIGLRVNEVCVIRGDAYSFDGQDAWIKIYQSKIKQEKVVPIPTRLYELMTRYIGENHIAADEYVFQSARGKAYDAGTFAKQFKKALREAGMEKYDFRSHDFRHTVATRLYDGGASIEVIRDYLGHRESDMTKQYLDYMPKRIDAANETYFRSMPAALAVETEG
jgi:integrase